MCGIVGYIGKKSFDKTKIKLLLFWNSQERGKDSTGVYTPKSGIIKSINEAKIFIKSDFSKVKDDNILIGHVRARSVGFNSYDNTHPFISENKNIIGCHNGTLLDKNRYASYYGIDGNKYEVDSKLLIELLDRTSSDNEIYYHCLSNIDGSAALLFYDVSSDYLNLFTNGDRPLFFGESKDEEGIYISSLKEALETTGCVNIRECSKNILYSINNDCVVYETTVNEANDYKEWCIIQDNKKKEELELKNKERSKYFNISQPFTIKSNTYLGNLPIIENISQNKVNCDKYIGLNKYYTIFGIWVEKVKNEKNIWYLTQIDSSPGFENYAWINKNCFDVKTESRLVSKGNIIKVQKQFNNIDSIIEDEKSYRIEKVDLFIGRDLYVASCVFTDKEHREYIYVHKTEYYKKTKVGGRIKLFINEIICSDITVHKELSEYFIEEDEDNKSITLVEEENSPYSRNISYVNKKENESKETTPEGILKGMYGRLKAIDNISNQIGNSYQKLPNMFQSEIADAVQNYSNSLTRLLESIEFLKQNIDVTNN